MNLSVWAQESTLVHSLKADVSILASDSFEGRGFGCASKSLALEYVNRQFALAGFGKLHKGTYLQRFMAFDFLSATEGTNIIGLIEGSDPILRHEYIIIGAHYDHLGWKRVDSTKVIYHGADDNASGVASLIQIGKILLSNKQNLKRSVLLIAFDGEEAGCFGSTDFVKRKIVDLLAIKAMFSLDMVGMYGKNKGVDFTGLFSLVGGKDLVKEMAVKSNTNINKIKQVIESRTDTQPFAEVEIPAIHVTTGDLSPYHKPEDTSGLLDYEGMAKVVELMAGITTELSNKTELKANPYFVHDVRNKLKSRFMIGVNVGLGASNFDYKNTYFNGKSIFSYKAGLETHLKLTKFVSFQTSVTYEAIGSQTSFGMLRINTLSPALDILVTTPNKENKPFSFISLGGFYRYNFSTNAINSFNFKDIYNEADSGIKISLGVHFYKTQFSFSSMYGLTPINKNRSNGDIFNKSNFFSIVRYF